MIYSINEWTVSGRVFYLKEMQGEFSASLKIRGEAKRSDGVYSSQIMEVGCLLPPNVYEQAKKKGLKLNRQLCITGHLETWNHNSKGKPIEDKVMFIADAILEVE